MEGDLHLSVSDVKEPEFEAEAGEPDSDLENQVQCLTLDQLLSALRPAGK